MIEVYDIGNENWENHGNAVLMPPEARVKMVAGGNYDMTMTHPIDPEGKWEHLVPGAVLRVPVPEERIENAFSGYAADIYRVTAQEAQVRESPVAPTTISYPEWSDQATYQVGDKVTTSLYWGNKNWRCTYFDANSPQAMVPPYASSWWEPIAGSTSGAAVLVTVQQGGELYFVEDVDATWYKLSTYYGVVGYVKKSQVAFYRHLDPDEVKPRIIKDQLMRITGATVDTKNRRVDVTAQHVSYDLNGTIVQEVAIAQASPAMAIGRMMENLMVPYRGTIATNLTSEDNGTYTDTIKGKSGMYCLLDPDKGIVGTFGAELHRDNWDLFIMAKTETDRGFRLRYRKNMLGVSWARKSDSLINRVVPVAKDEKGESLFLPEKWIDSEDIADYPVIRMEVLNVSGQVGKDKGDGTGDKWTLTDLYDEMRTKATERFSVDKVDQIVEDVTVDFEMLGDTAENPELKKLESVLLYDQVGAINETIGLDVMLTVTELEWDAVREKIVSLRLSSGNEKAGRNVTGYNVQNKSIGWKKLSDDVPQEILDQVKDIIPEYADPSASRPGVPNTVSQDGYVLKGQGQANKVWATDADGNPAWRAGGGGNYIPTSEKGAAGGVATLDNGGKVPASELPSYVDDVLEYASRSAFPATGESGKIYVAIDTGKTYRWSGSAYFELSTTAVTDNNPTLSWGQQAKVGSVAGTDLHVTMPANPNTDHYDWSDITNKPANYPGGCTGEAGSVAWANITGKPGSFYTLPLAANGTRGGIQVGYTQSGKNYPVQLSNEKAFVNVPWENTWRGIQNNLTSDSTTDSLSAAMGKKLQSEKVAKAGDTMTGNLAFSGSACVQFTGTKATYKMIKFIDNTSDTYGNGIYIGGGGQAIIGGGESSDVMAAQAGTGGAEIMWVGNDSDVNIFTNLQNGWDSRKTFNFSSGGTLTAPAFSGPLTGNVTGNCSGSAGSVAWSGVTDKPATATRWPAWSEVTDKPATATRWPAWSEVTSKAQIVSGVTFQGTNYDQSGYGRVNIGYAYDAKLQWGGANLAGDFSPVDAGIRPNFGANRFAGVPGSAVTVEYSRNAGSSWTDYGESADAKRDLFTTSASYYIGKADSSNKATANGGKYQLRVTVDTGAGNIYTMLCKFYIQVSTNGSANCTVRIQKALQSTPTTFVDVTGDVPLSGWSGWNVINVDAFTTYGNKASTQYGRVRFIFKDTTGGNTNYIGLLIYSIYGIGGTGWTTPSVLARTGFPFDYDGALNVTFPNKVTASGGFSGNVTGDCSGSAGSVAWSGVTSKPSYYDAKAIKSITRSGTTFTYTCLDNTTGTFTQQDNNTLVNIDGTERHMYVKNGQFDITAQSAKTVSFATAFPNACVSVVVHPTASFAGPTSISINSKAKGGFTVYLYSTNGLGGTFLYTAFGY